MGDKITLELTPGEAIVIHGAMLEKASSAQLQAAKLAASKAPAEEVAAATIVAQILTRQMGRLSDAIYPQPRCDWLAEDECDQIVAGKATNGRTYCAFHLRKTNAKAEALFA